MADITLNTLVYSDSGWVPAGVRRWVNRTLGLVSGFSDLTASIGLTKAKTTVKWKLVVPVIQDVATACACPGDVLQTTIVDVTVRMAPGATAAHRTDVRTRLQNLATKAEFIASIDGLTL